MTEKEIIQAWKINEKAWMFVPDEMKDWAMEHREEMRCCDDNTNVHLDRDYIAYRLRPDYPEPSGVAECEVKKSGDHLYYRSGGSLPDLHEAMDRADFIGYKSGEWLHGRLYRHKTGGGVSNIIRYADLDQYEVLPIDVVVFKEVR